MYVVVDPVVDVDVDDDSTGVAGSTCLLISEAWIRSIIRRLDK